MKIVKFRTSSNDKTIVETISHFLMVKRFAVSVHIKEVRSEYIWNGKVHVCTEYEMEGLTNTENVDNCYNAIKRLHNYEVPEFIYEKINCSDDIYDWLEKEINK